VIFKRTEAPLRLERQGWLYQALRLALPLDINRVRRYQALSEVAVQNVLR